MPNLKYRDLTKQERIDLFRSTGREMGVDEGDLTLLAIQLDDMEFFEKPASTRFHGTHEGGLFDHSYFVTTVLRDLTDRLSLTWSRKESPFLVGMLHDLCKCKTYVRTDTDKWEYWDSGYVPGHGERSLWIAENIIHLMEEEKVCIRWHMGAYEKDTSLWNYYGKAVEEYHNVLWTHTADMYASKVLHV